MAPRKSKTPKIDPVTGEPVKRKPVTKEQRVMRAAAAWANSEGFGLAFSLLGAEAKQQIGAKCVALIRTKKALDKAQRKYDAATTECKVQVEALREAQGAVEAASKGAIARLSAATTAPEGTTESAPKPGDDDFAS